MIDETRAFIVLGRKLTPMRAKRGFTAGTTIEVQRAVPLPAANCTCMAAREHCARHRARRCAGLLLSGVICRPAGSADVTRAPLANTSGRDILSAAALPPAAGAGRAGAESSNSALAAAPDAGRIGTAGLPICRSKVTRVTPKSAIVRNARMGLSNISPTPRPNGSDDHTPAFGRGAGTGAGDARDIKGDRVIHGLVEQYAASSSQCWCVPSRAPPCRGRPTANGMNWEQREVDGMGSPPEYDSWSRRGARHVDWVGKHVIATTALVGSPRTARAGSDGGIPITAIHDLRRRPTTRRRGAAARKMRLRCRRSTLGSPLER